MQDFIKINKDDNVAVALKPIAKAYKYFAANCQRNYANFSSSRAKSLTTALIPLSLISVI